MAEIKFFCTVIKKHLNSLSYITNFNRTNSIIMQIIRGLNNGFKQNLRPS